MQIIIEWIKNNYKLLLSFILGVIVTLATNSNRIEPVSFQTKVETKVETKTVVQNKTQVKNICQAKIVEKPDGTKETTITADSGSEQESVANTQTLSQIEAKSTVSAATRARGLSLGVSIAALPNLPPKITKESVGFSIGVPIGEHFSIEGGYKLDGTISIGGRYEF